MAGQGTTKVQAVSRMLMAIGQNRVTSLDTAGTSDAADAEIYLDEVINEFIIAGRHPSCIRRHVPLTANGSGIVDLSSAAPNALKIVGAGKYQRREFTIRNQTVYDPTDGTTTGASFAAAEQITVDIYEAVSSSSPANFEGLDPVFKIDILKEAVIRFAAAKKPDAMRDGLYARERNQINANPVPIAPNLPDAMGNVIITGIQSQNPGVQMTQNR